MYTCTCIYTYIQIAVNHRGYLSTSLCRELAREKHNLGQKVATVFSSKQVYTRLRNTFRYADTYMLMATWSVCI